MKNGDQPAIKTAEEKFDETYPTMHSPQRREVIGWYKSGYSDALLEAMKVSHNNRRFELAKAAMQGLCADRHNSDTQGEPKNIAAIAVQCADELLKALES